MRDDQYQSARPAGGRVKKLRVKNETFSSRTLNSSRNNSTEEPVLQESLHVLKSMLDTMPNPISYEDRNGKFLGVNESFARQIFGLPENEIVGYTFPEICSRLVELFPNRSAWQGIDFKNICREWGREDAALLKSGGFQTQEQKVVFANGTENIFLVNRSTFKDVNGEISGFITVLQDITELKLSKKALEDNEEKYRIFTEQTGQLVYDYDFKSDRGYLGGTIEEITGYLPQELQGISYSHWIEYFHPEDRERLVKRGLQVQKKGGKYGGEFRFRKKDGTYLYVEDSGICLLDKNGKPYRILGAIKDITERKLAQERLELSEEKYRSFIHNFKGIAFQLDENLVPEFVHGAIEEITGYTEEDFVSTSIWWNDIIHPDDLPAVLKQVMKIKNSRRSYDTEFEYRIKRRDGEIRWVNELYQKIPGKDGKPDKYQGAVYDITEKKESQEALNEIKEARLKEIHHRIKNNLQVISSLLDLQAEKFRDEKVREAFRESQSRITSMALIHEELYQEKNIESLNFAAYIRKLSDNLFHTYRLDHPGISLKMDLKENIFLNVDIAVPLGIITNELVSNSLKHAFPGQKKGIIQIRLYEKEKIADKFENNKYKEPACRNGSEGTKLVLAVSDNGVGIPESIDLKNPSTLGLQLVGVLINQLDGELEFKRTNGTEFITRVTIEENP